MIVRPELPGDTDAIRAVICAAFTDHQHSDGSEPAIVDRLRDDDALAISLIAENHGIVGHIAFSEVIISDGTCGWFGLGPVSVLPEKHGVGIGSRLVRDGIKRLSAMGAAGCVLLGDPGYYRRFGFASVPTLDYPGAPAGYFQHLVLSGALAEGTVTYHPAFG